MTIKKTSDLYALIGAIAFTIHGLYILYDIFYFMSLGLSIWSFRLLHLVICIGFAFLLFIKKKNVAFVVVSGLDVLYRAYITINYFTFASFLELLASISMFIIIVYNCSKTRNDKSEIMKKVWFIPSLLIVLRFLYLLIFHRIGNYILYLSEYENGMLLNYILNQLLLLFIDFIYFLSYTMLALWFKEKAKEDSNSKVV